jgi:hypothetical protein
MAISCRIFLLLVCPAALNTAKVSSVKKWYLQRRTQDLRSQQLAGLKDWIIRSTYALKIIEKLRLIISLQSDTSSFKIQNKHFAEMTGWNEKITDGLSLEQC